MNSDLLQMMSSLFLLHLPPCLLNGLLELFLGRNLLPVVHSAHNSYYNFGDFPTFSSLSIALRNLRGGGAPPRPVTVSPLLSPFAEIPYYHSDSLVALCSCFQLWIHALCKRSRVRAKVYVNWTCFHSQEVIFNTLPHLVFMARNTFPEYHYLSRNPRKHTAQRFLYSLQYENHQIKEREGKMWTRWAPWRWFEWSKQVALGHCCVSINVEGSGHSCTGQISMGLIQITLSTLQC